MKGLAVPSTLRASLFRLGRPRFAVRLVVAVECVLVFLPIAAGICDEPVGEPVDPVQLLAE
jgi:hypothetical protein